MLIIKTIGVFHYYFNSQITCLSSLFINHCERARNLTLYDHFSEWDPHTAYIVSHPTHSHIHRLIDQINRQHLALHILQKLRGALNLELFCAFKQRVASLCGGRSYFESVKIVAEKG